MLAAQLTIDPRRKERDGATPAVRGGEFGYLGLRLVQYGLLFVATLLVAHGVGPSGRAHYALPLARSAAYMS